MYLFGHKRWNGAIGKNKFIEFVVIISGSYLNNFMTSTTRGFQIVIHNFHVENYLHIENRALQQASDVMKFDPTQLFSLVPINDYLWKLGSSASSWVPSTGCPRENQSTFLCNYMVFLHGTICKVYEWWCTIIPNVFNSLFLKIDFVLNTL